MGYEQLITLVSGQVYPTFQLIQHRLLPHWHRLNTQCFGSTINTREEVHIMPHKHRTSNGTFRLATLYPVLPWWLQIARSILRQQMATCTQYGRMGPSDGAISFAEQLDLPPPWLLMEPFTSPPVALCLPWSRMGS